jgi:excinuclease ABC subunit B
MFHIQSPYKPNGDQPAAIEKLVKGVNDNEQYQTLLGVTGSGKTFTIANVIQQTNKPTLVLTHNKTLVAQLYGELRAFFPDNAVEYFVSYYDYYQPEAYLPSTGVYIEKDLAVNAELEKLRLRTTASLLSGRRDIIVVASVSCIYGLGNPKDYENGIIRISKGQNYGRNHFLHQLVNAIYARSAMEFDRGMFRVKGDTVDINLPYADYGYRIIFFGDEIEEIQRIETVTGKKIASMDDAAIFPANIYLAPQDQMKNIIHEIQDEAFSQEAYFKQEQKFAEAQRIKERVAYDIK